MSSQLPKRNLCVAVHTFDDFLGLYNINLNSAAKVSLLGGSNLHFNVSSLLKNHLGLKKVTVFSKIWPHFMFIGFIRPSS